MTITDLGQVLGAAAAGFAASWAALPARLKKEIAGDESLALVRQKLDGIDKTVTEVKESVKRMEDRVARAVSDEEFAAYTSHTSEAIHSLTEKVGHATGAIESWYRTNHR